MAKACLLLSDFVCSISNDRLLPPGLADFAERLVFSCLVWWDLCQRLAFSCPAGWILGQSAMPLSGATKDEDDLRRSLLCGGLMVHFIWNEDAFLRIFKVEFTSEVLADLGRCPRVIEPLIVLTRWGE